MGVTLLCAALLGFQIFRMMASARISEAATQLNLALERLVKQYEQEKRLPLTTDVDTPRLIDNSQVLHRLALEALTEFPGVEGGFYSHSQARLLGYAYPTYLGSGPKTDIPEAERATITGVVHRGVQSSTQVFEQIESGFDALLFAAAPLLHNDRLVGAAWLMHRLPGIRNPQWQYYNLSLLALLTMVCLVSGGAWAIARGLDRSIGQMLAGIRTLQDTRAQSLSPTKYTELNRVVSAINHLTETVHVQQTRREQLERRLQQADRLAILGRLVAGVAHEVRNPLSSIRLKLQLARRGKTDVLKLMGAFDVVEQEITRLDRLVARLLSVAKPCPAACDPTDLPVFLEARIQQWTAQASDQRITVEWFDAGNEPFVIPFDQDRLGQILDNLMANAFDALNGVGGFIRISLKRHGLDAFTITVADSGPGIPLQASEHLFEPFFTTKPHGTGLGLFLSAEIARAAGGTLTAVEATHGGACFELILPCRSLTSAGLEADPEGALVRHA